MEFISFLVFPHVMAKVVGGVGECCHPGAASGSMRNGLQLLYVVSKSKNQVLSLFPGRVELQEGKPQVNVYLCQVESHGHKL